MAFRRSILTLTLAALAFAAAAHGSTFACDKQDGQTTASAAKPGCAKDAAATAKSDAPCSKQAAQTASAKQGGSPKAAKAQPAAAKSGCAKGGGAKKTATAEKKADDASKKAEPAVVAEAR